MFLVKKAFRFGVVTGGHESRSAWFTLAQRVEELGYASLLMPVVLGTPLATMTALAVAATATTILRVGSYVFVNDYLNPALLAREIATLHQHPAPPAEPRHTPGTAHPHYHHPPIPSP